MADFQDLRSVSAHLKTLLNNDLKTICRKENLTISGVKAHLQERILSHLIAAKDKNDVAAYDQIKHRIYHRGQSPPAVYSGSGNAPHNAFPAPGTHLNPMSRNQQTNVPGRYPALSISPRVYHMSFRPSPFYRIQEALSPVSDLNEMPASRYNVSAPITLTATHCDNLRADSNLRVMLYCAVSPGGPYQVSDVAFPAQFEVKINQEEVKSNFKGLKGKPGTTKPADLTAFVRKSASASNMIHIAWALTTRKYSFVVNLVRRSTADELTERIRSGKVIPKETVLREMREKANDSDIVATSSKVSLKDPISTMRMTLPCRSTICTHSQCFDALSFLQLQEQAPAWSCPICSKTISYETLAVDHYFLDILQRTSKNLDQVIVEPDGEWHEQKTGDDQGAPPKSQPRAAYDDDSDEDLVEIEDPGGAPLKLGGVGNHMTPPLSSRETSVANLHAATNGNNKRQSTVIDLTASDDEEDEPPRPAKRHAGSSSYSTPASLSDQRTWENGRLPARPSTLYSGFAGMQSPQPMMNLASPRAASVSSNDAAATGAQRGNWPSGYAQFGSPWSGDTYPGGRQP